MKLSCAGADVIFPSADSVITREHLGQAICDGPVGRCTSIGRLHLGHFSSIVSFTWWALVAGVTSRGV
ncbi:hypothetical protein N9N28_01270 [Rubripirellula amarantea]|nr:hypothetical protein [Rubripirellula amarantea]